RGYAHRIDVNAPVEMVWHGLIDPKMISLWYGPGARVSAKAGGSYYVRADRDLEREAHIDVFDPGRRLRLIYMPPPGLPENDAVIVDDFILDTEQGVAVLRLLGSGFPMDDGWDVYYQRLRGGWGQALARLKVAVERQAKAKSA
ncbi:MAG: SRPBCC domain-containing protein, partial [Proteobacteria bacterium]|nr:SRPBCC domain-containing protein [Pseudomonadota bacterium]